MIVLKSCAKALSSILCHLINTSLANGVFPERLKISIVKPLHKKGCTLDVNNYRPITLIPILSKIYEKVMHLRLREFLNKNKIIKEEQNGFQKGKSTTLAAFSLVKSITENIDKKQPVTVVFLDMSKAFDLVNYDKLLDKCERYGIRGPALDWLRSYLCGRTQCVELSRIEKTKMTSTTYRSHIKGNRSGVPQGSILGPPLFLLYINDLPNTTNHKCVLFADDVSVIIPSNNNTQNHEKEVHDTMNDIVGWLTLNDLKVNLSKTKYVHFSNYNQIKKHNFDITFEEEKINRDDNIRFLGITLDEHCNWKLHINTVCKKLNRFVYALRQLRKTVSETAALTAYHGHVSSILRYGLLLWGNSPHISRAFIIQKKCIRAISNVGPFETCRPLFKKLGVLTLASMYIMEIGMFIRNQKHLFVDSNENRRYKSRDPTKLNIHTSCRSALYKKNSYRMSIKIYNHFPRPLRELPSYKFHKQLKSWLLENCFYTLNEFFNCTT